MSGPSTQRLMDAPVAASGRLPHATASRQELLALYRAALARGLHGLCFSAYLPGQSPELGSRISEAQIRARLEVIRPFTRWVRSFSCTDGNEAIPRLAHELGMKTLVGAWLGTDREKNEAELAGAIEVARAGHADILAIGNEVLLREDLREDELIDYLRRVQEALPGTPVAYVDAYYLFTGIRGWSQACDVAPRELLPVLGVLHPRALARLHEGDASPAWPASPAAGRSSSARPAGRAPGSPVGERRPVGGERPALPAGHAGVDRRPRASTSSGSPPSTRRGRPAPRATAA